MSRAGCISYGMVTPLGETAEAVFSSILEGRTRLCRHDGTFGCKEPFVASLLDREKYREPGYNLFETVSIEAARKAIEAAGIHPDSGRVGFVLSSIKGNIEAIGSEDVTLAHSAVRIARAFNNPNPPLVVSNACISGLAAIVQARRMILHGDYDHIVVIGTEIQSRFIVSGFQSLKALSMAPCRPFDAGRDGLNLGEASAAMIIGHEGGWEIVDGAVRNDANHISGPSRTGEGSFNALRYVLRKADVSELAFVNVHGTATLYNDEMESFALERAGLQNVPVNALKGYFGHTMGAAGILESALSMMACDRGVILPTKGFGQLGVTHPINVNATLAKTSGTSFIKLLSGFGGVNGAVLFRKGGLE